MDRSAIMHPALEDLIDDDFEATIRSASTPLGARMLVLSSQEFPPLLRQIKEGAIPASQIRSFVTRLLSSYRKGERFHYMAALITICTIGEHIKNSFFREFTTELASLSALELQLAIDCARKTNTQKAVLASTVLQEESYIFSEPQWDDARFETSTDFRFLSCQS